MQINTVFGLEEVSDTKKCVYCKEEKSISEFRGHPGYKDKLDIRCNSCINFRTHLVKNLKKFAPEKPEKCQCCNNKIKNLVLDHCPKTNDFRGWICGNCNKGIGMLGDNTEGLLKALSYLKKSEKVILDNVFEIE